jgi:serine protease Do
VLKDPRRDLALVRIAAGGLAAAESGDANTLRPGEVVLAVGNPMGFEGALTTGVVHAVGPIRGLGRTRWVQADVRLAPGNSGGPLADAHGRVVGINTMIAGGLGLAVPVNAVRQLVENGPSPSLGVTVRPMPVAIAGKNSLGLMLLELDNDGAAAHASLLPGDLLTGVNGRSFDTMDDLADAIEHGKPVKVQFMRAGGSTVREVTVAFEKGRARAA